jgi:hypothetical protein
LRPSRNTIGSKPSRAIGWARGVNQGTGALFATDAVDRKRHPGKDSHSGKHLPQPSRRNHVAAFRQEHVPAFPVLALHQAGGRIRHRPAWSRVLQGRKRPGIMINPISPRSNRHRPKTVPRRVKPTPRRFMGLGRRAMAPRSALTTPGPIEFTVFAYIRSLCAWFSVRARLWFLCPLSSGSMLKNVWSLSPGVPFPWLRVRVDRFQNYFSKKITMQKIDLSPTPLDSPPRQGRLVVSAPSSAESSPLAAAPLFAHV